MATALDTENWHLYLFRLKRRKVLASERTALDRNVCGWIPTADSSGLRWLVKVANFLRQHP